METEFRWFDRFPLQEISIAPFCLTGEFNSLRYRQLLRKLQG